jgi:hypothetical protein
MLTASLDETKGRARGGGGGGTPKGSRRFATLSDGSVVRWWGGRWYRKWMRFDTAVATSLSRYAMAAAVEAGRMREEREEYKDCGEMLKRLSALVGTYEALRIIGWIARKEAM